MSSILSSIPLFRDLPKRALKAAEKEMSHFSVPGGSNLIEEGANSDAIYFVLSGSFGAFSRPPNNRMEFLGHIRPGEPIGEMAMLAGEPHNNAVFAVRDSEVVKLPRTTFMKLVKASPAVLERLSRILLIRLRQSKRPKQRAEPKVFALVATSPTIDVQMRAKVLADALAQIGLNAIIVGEEAGQPSGNFFDELEQTHDVVILTSTLGDNPWFRLSHRQADRIWLLARRDARPSSPLLPDEWSPANQLRLIDIVLIENDETRSVSKPLDWLDAANAARCFHWHGVSQFDADRLARIMAGRSVGLCLSGGGARAYAHIGVVKALRESGCPIDFTGGASMGAIIAACVAKGWDDHEIDWRIRKAFVDSNPLGDYNLPVVALVKGQRVDTRLREHFGDICITELEIPFFAVSTNLTSGNIRLHNRGPLTQALRASIALPGILPPVVEDGQVLVDGAVLNNFPADIIRSMHRGFVIGSDVARAQKGLSAEDFIDPPEFTTWVTRNRMQSAPPIASLLMRSATVSVNPSDGHELTDMLVLPEIGDRDMRDWEEFDEVVQAGYDAAMSAIKTARGPVSRVFKNRTA